MNFFHPYQRKHETKLFTIQTNVPMDMQTKTYSKKLDGTDIWEFRTLYNGVCYRLLSFWDTEKSALVIAVNGFQKKTQKTPKQEIQKAIEIRKEYFNSKH